MKFLFVFTFFFNMQISICTLLRTCINYFHWHLHVFLTIDHRQVKNVHDISNLITFPKMTWKLYAFLFSSSLPRGCCILQTLFSIICPFLLYKSTMRLDAFGQCYFQYVFSFVWQKTGERRIMRVHKLNHFSASSKGSNFTQSPPDVLCVCMIKNGHYSWLCNKRSIFR